MTKPLLSFFIFFLLNAHYLIGQKLLGNEWINYGQSYLKLSIDKDGLYRISKKDLESSGFDTNQLNPKYFELYFRGKPYAIYFYGEEDGKIDDTDYIEFYAIANDGFQDQEVYRPKSARTNTFLSLYSNETGYFLTHNNFFGKRIKLDEPSGFELSDPYYISKIIKNFEEDWNHDILTSGIPNLLQSYFEPHESVMSERYSMNFEPSVFTENITLKNYNSALSNKIELKAKLGSRNYPDKSILISIGDTSKALSLSNYNTGEVSIQNINSENENITLRANIEKSNSTIMLEGKKQDSFSMLYYYLRYPTKLVFTNNSEYELIPNANNHSTLTLSNANNQTAGYDIKDIYNQRKLHIEFEASSGQINLNVNDTKNGGRIWLSNQPFSPKKIQRINFEINDISNVNFVIITDSLLKQGANEYKKYRESTNGGGHKVLIVYKHQLYNEFFYGERNPMAINRFAEYLLKKSQVKNLLLLGKALSYPRLFKSNEGDDLVPTFGYPASDALLTAGINGNGVDIQTIPTGRVSAVNNQQVLDYLGKVKEFESNKNTSWNKNFLQMSGGKGEYQVAEFKELLDKLGKIANNGKLGASYKLINKTKINDGVENVDISQEINNGVGMLTFFGHSTSDKLDLNIGLVSDEKANFKNAPQYPFMFFNGCGAGNAFNTYTSLTNDWLITPQKGAIAILAHSFLSFSYSNSVYMEKLYRRYFSSVEMLNKPIGEVVKIVNAEIINENPNDIYLIANTHQMILHGDPAIRIFNITKPDYQTEDGKIFLSSKVFNQSITENAEINVGLAVANFGIYEKGTKVSLNLKKTFLDGKSSNETIQIDAIPNSDTLFFILKKDLSLKNISFSLDSETIIDEIDENNNLASLTFNWELLKTTNYFSTALIEDKLSPQLEVKLDNRLPIDSMITSKNPLLSIHLTDDSSLGNKNDKIDIILKKLCENCVETSKSIQLINLTGDLNEIIGQVKLGELEPGTYQLFIQGFDAKKNVSGEVFTVKFVVPEINNESIVTVFPNPVTLFAQFDLTTDVLNDNYQLEISDSRGVLIYSKTGPIFNGKESIFWNGKNNQNEPIMSGLFIYKLNFLQSNQQKQTKIGKIIFRQ
ncbi:MAG: C25 family cysteine peptidase [Bacteroidota bacterium]